MNSRKHSTLLVVLLGTVLAADTVNAEVLGWADIMHVGQSTAVIHPNDSNFPEVAETWSPFSSVCRPQGSNWVCYYLGWAKNGGQTIAGAANARSRVGVWSSDDDPSRCGTLKHIVRLYRYPQANLVPLGTGNCYPVGTQPTVWVFVRETEWTVDTCGTDKYSSSNYLQVNHSGAGSYVQPPQWYPYNVDFYTSVSIGGLVTDYAWGNACYHIYWYS